MLRQLPQLLAVLPGISDTIEAKVYSFIIAAPPEVQDFLLQMINNIISEGLSLPSTLYNSLLKLVTNYAGYLPAVFLFVITATLATFFIRSEYPSVVGLIMRQIPRQWHMRVLNTKRHLMSTMGKWAKAQLMLMGLTFIQLFFGFLIIRVEYAILLAVIVARIDALPVFGTGSVLLPWAVFSLLCGDSSRAISLVILYLVIYLVRCGMEPKLVGGQIGIPPPATLIAMYSGYSFFGVLGMLSFPILLIILKQFYDWGYIRLWK